MSSNSPEARGSLGVLSRESKAPAVPPPRFDWKTRVLGPVLIMLAAGALIAHSARDALWPATPVKVVPVVMKTGTESAGTVSVQAAGWVEADPFPIGVSALADGVVKEVLFLEGQRVKAGEVVARLVDDDAKLAVSQAAAELADRQAALEAAQKQWAHPIERTRAVATAEALLAETTAEFARLEADVKVETARLSEVRDRLQRNIRTFELSAGAEYEVQQTKFQVQAQEAQLKATQSRKAVLEAQIQQRQAELAAARENLELRIEDRRELEQAKAAVAMAQAKLDEAKLRLDRMEIRSPADGIVLVRWIQPGSKVMLQGDDKHSAHAFHLYDPKQLQVRVDVPLADAAKVGVGQEAKIVVGVLPNETFDGKVTRIVHEADIQKNTLQVKVAIEAPTEQLKPEMLARVKFISAESTTGTPGSLTMFVPENLVQQGAGGTMVWVVDPRNNVAAARPIQLGQSRQDGWVSVTSGLQPGEQIVATNLESLHPGSKVKVIGEVDQPAAAAPQASKEVARGSH